MRVLVVEDDYLVATGLSGDLRALGITVIGPFRTIEDAIESVDDAGAAILDIGLAEGNSFALAEVLRGRQVPLIFYTGQQGNRPARFADIRAFTKPTAASRLLADLKDQRERLRETAPPQTAVCDTLPFLRSEACLLMQDAGAADRLVEATLQRAIHLADRWDKSENLEIWLGRLLYLEHRRLHARLRH